MLRIYYLYGNAETLFDTLTANEILCGPPFVVHSLSAACTIVEVDVTVSGATAAVDSDGSS